MNRRGISPLIASVFLVGFAIVIGVFVFISTFNLNTGLIEDQNKRIENAVLLSFDARYPNKADCATLCAGADIQCLSSNCYCILIENEENQDVNFIVKTNGEFGSEICSPENFKLDPFQSKIFAVGFDGSSIGVNNIRAEVDAVLILDN
ncbi:hypothetical protein HN865_01905 [Candidatus Woesearchaeota archaeon]|jgi:flagellin-like protein|nr:hypothetical protein [Cryomorphaceae bacterium]MBT6995762.1 hypothetical protein [Candidatus Woesearchaeota archaeon]MBT7237590.1 hypothetical protein [Candidatus Woesearchaeota archaeon]